MESKIILITNRGVRPNRTGETLFKNKLTKSDHRLRCAVVNPGSKRGKYALTLIGEGQEQAFVNDAIANSNGKPWVFFVHGNNQTLNKNLKKCFDLRKLYGVNVLAFSWPSTHYGKIRNIAAFFPLKPTITGNIGKYVKRKLKQYGKARKNAGLSAQDLASSLMLFKSAVAGTNVTTNFICHSLGHRVLKLSSEYQDLSNSMEPFGKVLLHQADEDNSNHKDWVLPIGKGENTVVTTNKKDKVLLLSNIYNHRSKENQRLGNVPKNDEASPPTYKDFTGVKKIGLSGHTAFLTEHKDNPEVYSYFKSVIAG